jgi:hypothetical protein
MPSWLNYRQDENNFMIIEGIPENKDQGDYNLLLGITDGKNTINNNINLKVLNVSDPLTLNIRNNPSHGDYIIDINVPGEAVTVDVAVYNLAGAILYNATFENVTNEILVPLDLTNRAKCTYLLEVKTDKSRVTRNLVLL